jgi:O-acetylserine/cysteine efflux transporter
MAPRDILIALAVVVVWGVNFVAIDWGVAEVPPLLLTALRYVVAAFPALLFVRRPKVALGILVGYGLAVGVGQFGLLFSAIKLGMPAGLASLVIQLQAFFTIALAVLFLGERPRLSQIAGAAVAFIGIGIIAVERAGGAALWPLLMTVLAGACWGVANLMTKKAGKVDMLGFVVWSALVPPIPLYLLSLLFEGPGAVPLALSRISLLGGGSLLFIGWVSTLFGYGLWSVLLGRYPASTVAPYTLLVPVVGIGASALLLGESIDVVELLGSLLVFIGLLVNGFGPRLMARRNTGLTPP